jgi:hypothetical protein
MIRRLALPTVVLLFLALGHSASFAAVHRHPPPAANTPLTQQASLTDAQNRLGEQVRQQAQATQTLQGTVQGLAQDQKALADKVSTMQGRYDAKLENTPLLSASNVISLVALLLSLATAWWSYRTGRKADRKKLTLDIWDQYLDRYNEIGAARGVLRGRPTTATAEEFSSVQIVRNWMDGIATLVYEARALDEKILNALGIVQPMRAFMVELEGARDEVKKAKDAGAMIPAYLTYQDEVQASGNIRRLCGLKP